MVVTRSSSKETDRFVTAFSTGSESLSSRLVFERVGGRQGSERFAQLPAEQRRRLRNDVGDFPVRSRALGFNRRIITRWMSLPPRVRFATARHSASSQALLRACIDSAFMCCAIASVSSLSLCPRIHI